MAPPRSAAAPPPSPSPAPLDAALALQQALSLAVRHLDALPLPWVIRGRLGRSYGAREGTTVLMLSSPTGYRRAAAAGRLALRSGELVTLAVAGEAGDPAAALLSDALELKSRDTGHAISRRRADPPPPCTWSRADSDTLVREPFGWSLAHLLRVLDVEPLRITVAEPKPTTPSGTAPDDAAPQTTGNKGES